jgi:hypothetical protein
MPRISLWKENHSNDYKFFDNRIREMFTAGGVGIYIHKLLGLDINSAKVGDATQPTYLNASEKNIQDLLFLENRDRKYEPDIYKLRGHYTLSDNDFNLSQFGMFLNNDTLFITFHINDMIERIGRKLIPGDVLEIPNMKDLWPLDDTVPISLKKFYVVNEVLRAAEGYSQTWWPHLYRIRAVPLVDSQEYKEILDQAVVDSDGNATTSTLKDIMSPYLKNLELNDAIIAQAESDVPLSGYNTDKLFVLPVDANNLSLQNYISSNGNVSNGSITANGNVSTTDHNSEPALMSVAQMASTTGVGGNVATPTSNILTYLLGSSTAPNGFSVRSLTYFPDGPNVGEYVLRTDYRPNVLFRWDGRRWGSVNEVRRSTITGQSDQTQLGTFFNNTAKTKLSSGNVIDQKQALSKIFGPKSDF